MTHLLLVLKAKIKVMQHIADCRSKGEHLKWNYIVECLRIWAKKKGKRGFQKREGISLPAQ